MVSCVLWYYQLTPPPFIPSADVFAAPDLSSPSAHDPDAAYITESQTYYSHLTPADAPLLSYLF